MAATESATTSKFARILSGALAGVLLLIPFHALLTVWAASNFGHYEAWRLWPEVVFALLAPIAVYLWWHKPQLRQALGCDVLLWCMAAYIALHLILGAWALHTGQVNLKALGTALILNLRPMVFFLLAWVAASYSPWLKQHWRALVLGPALLVISFGILQAWVLPADVLRHAGYGPTTIVPYEAVDQKTAYARVQSTLRGPNPLGAYLIIIATAIAAIGVKTWKRRDTRTQGFGLLAATLVVIFYTYSRSAYIGVVVALMVLGWLALRHERAKRILVMCLIGLALVGSLGLVLLRNNDHVQNVFFHTDEHSQSARSSNQDRAFALQNGLRDIIHQPVGRGPGTAGPASQHNNHAPRIAENYYLQLGQELGLIGLGLFVVINVYIVQRLWQRRADTLALTLLASFAGITVVAMLSHAWTDDTLAIVWWSFAGVALATKPIHN